MRPFLTALLLVASGLLQPALAQTPLSNPADSTLTRPTSRPNAAWRPAVRVLLPAGLIGAAAFGCHRNNVVYEMREEMQEETREFFPRGLRTNLDDYTRHAPVVAAYALHAVGMKPVRGIGAFTICHGLAHALNSGVVSHLKRAAAVSRPDNPKDLSSFPSAHTAQAFMTATLLHEQFGHGRPWVSVSGYAVATATGAMRMMHNRHWLTDVVAGASIGFLSAEAVWRLYPQVARLMPGKIGQKVFIVPTYVPGGTLGVAVAVK